MRAIRPLAWACLVLIALATSVLARSEIAGKVVRVADGDTITVLAPGNRQVKVRLYGIDCPERRQAFGRRARQFTSSRVAGRDVRVEILDTDRYGRSVGVVYPGGGESVNRELVRNGLAWVYARYCKASFCGEWKRDELLARQSGIGLWGDRDPIEPWEFRKRGRQ